MEAIRNAANAAASYVGYDQTAEADKTETGNTLGELVHDRNTSGTTQSGREPVSGKLGSGTAGQPYDAGNDESYNSTTSGSSGLTGPSSHNTTSGLAGHNTTAGNYSTGSGQGNASGYESTSGYGNNTGYDESTSRGLGAESRQQANHYTSTAEAGKLSSATGLAATHRVGDGSSQHHTGHSSHTSHTTGTDRDSTQNKHSGNHSTSSGSNAYGLGSDSSASKSGDRYLFDARNAPGAGGRHTKIVDDFTDSNIHHEGSGSGVGGHLGADVNSGTAGTGAAGAGLGSGYTGTGHHSGFSSSTGTGATSGSGLSDKGKERSRKPGFERMGSGLSYGNTGHGLNSGAPRESIGTKLERKGEEAALGAAAATGIGAAGYGASHSGREPLSGQRGSGVAGEPYDQGNKYDGASYQNTGSSRGLDQDSQVSQTTSGLGNLNLRDRQADTSPSYAQSSGLQGHATDDPAKNNSGLNLVGFSDGASDRRTGTNDRDIGTSSHNTSTSGTSGSGYDGYSGPNRTNESRLAEHGRDFGATAPRNESDVPRSATAAYADECVENHHLAHPVGEGAHRDGTHKPTFLNYSNDKFGVPTARGP